VVNLTEVVTYQQSRVSSTRNIRETNPMKIESGGKVFYLLARTIENFTFRLKKFILCMYLAINYKMLFISENLRHVF